ncbi:MAG: PLDc N-terminal domain-containing protein [Propionibacterium sp.]
MSQFSEFFWLIIEIFFFVAYLIVFFQIIGDLFRDKQLGGLAKAIWIFVLIVIPLVGALIYLIARGRGMDERRRQAALDAEQNVQAYIRQAVGPNPVSEIAQAQELLEKGSISAQEFEALKRKALGE